MNNQTFVNDTLGLIGVLPGGVDASAEDAALALRVIDEMTAEWDEEGVTVSWTPSAETGDDCPLQGIEKTAVQYSLAIRLCPHFGREPPPVVIALAQSTYAKLQKAQMVRGLEPITLDAPQAEAGWPRYNILTDTF